MLQSWVREIISYWTWIVAEYEVTPIYLVQHWSVRVSISNWASDPRLAYLGYYQLADQLDSMAGKKGV